MQILIYHIYNCPNMPHVFCYSIFNKYEYLKMKVFLPDFAFYFKNMIKFQITPKHFEILSFSFLYYKL
jgi:hypothetical protein